MWKVIRNRIKKLIKIIRLVIADEEVTTHRLLWSIIKLCTSFKKLRQASAALTYHTILSIVPVLSLMVAVANGLGYSDLFKQHIYIMLTGQELVADQLLSYANRYLDTAQTNLWFGICIGLVVLFYSVFSIFRTIDETFNSLWNNEGRSFKRLLKIYSFILIIPIVTILFAGLWWSVSSIFEGTPMQTINLYILTVCSYVFVLFAIYTLVPTTKVLKKYSAISAVVCGLIFAFMQFLGYHIVEMFSNYKTIYGNLAAMIIFLLWIYYSWTICLAGSKWNYYLQEADKNENQNQYNKISSRYYNFLSILIIERIESLYPQSVPFRQKDLVKNVSQVYGIPTHLTINIIKGFKEKKILQETKGEYFQLCKRFSNLTIEQLVSKLNSVGKNLCVIKSLPKIHHNKKLDLIWEEINKETSDFSSENMKILIRDINDR